jgi:hypothetical protein
MWPNTSFLITEIVITSIHFQFSLKQRKIISVKKFYWPLTVWYEVNIYFGVLHFRLEEWENTENIWRLQLPYLRKTYIYLSSKVLQRI